jgi:hypothetical protein
VFDPDGEAEAEIEPEAEDAGLVALCATDDALAMTDEADAMTDEADAMADELSDAEDVATDVTCEFEAVLKAFEEVALVSIGGTENTEMVERGSGVKDDSTWRR